MMKADARGSIFGKDDRVESSIMTKGVGTSSRLGVEGMGEEI